MWSNGSRTERAELPTELPEAVSGAHGTPPGTDTQTRERASLEHVASRTPDYTAWAEEGECRRGRTSIR